jgi:hypothetical protein
MNNFGNASYFWLYWGSPRCMSNPKGVYVLLWVHTLMEYERKILCTSTLSHLLLKLRAVKVDISISKEPFQTDQVMLVPYASVVRSNICIQEWICPIYDWDNWQINYKFINGPFKKLSRNLAIHASQ